MLLSRVLQFKNRYTQYSEMTCIHIFILWMAMSSYISALFHAVLCCIAGNLCPGHHGSQYGAPSLNNVNINVSISMSELGSTCIVAGIGVYQQG